MLQNRYGDREFPVRDRWSTVRPTRQALQRQAPNRTALRGMGAVLPAVLLLVVAGGVLLPGAGSRTGDGIGFLLVLVLFVVLVAAGLTVLGLVDRSLPRREQERYRRLAGGDAITDRQQQLLALDAQSDYAIGAWNSSLDYGPAWSRMPAATRVSSEHAARPFFVTMPVFAVGPMRAELDAQEHIASGADVELFVADALRESSLSARFHHVLHGPDGERMLARVASLTGTDQWALRDLDEPLDGRPPRLLWAADSQRVIAVVRMAYLAEHIDAGTAWRLVERAAEPALGLYGSWEEYWAGVRTGLAFRADRLEAVQRFDESLAGLRGSAWPAARAAFPAGPVPAWLPAFDTDGSPAPDARG